MGPPADRSDLLLRGVRQALGHRAYQAACTRATVLADLLDGAAGEDARALCAALRAVTRARREADVLEVRDRLAEALARLDSLSRLITGLPG